MRADASTPVTLLELEHWALGRLDPERAAALEALGADDPDLKARMERVQRQIQDASLDLPPLELPEEDEAPARAGWLAWLSRPAFGGLAVALAAAVALVVVLVPDRPVEDPDTWRGGEVMDLELMRVRLGQASPQGALVSAQPGDRLQFTISAPSAGWLQIYDLQDDGVVQAWLEPIQIEAKTPMERAVLLDDYAGSERIFFLISSEPVPLQRVEQAAQQAFHQPLPALDRLPGLGAGVLQRSVLVIKEPNP